MRDFTNKLETLVQEYSSIERVLLDVTEERGRQIAKGFDAAHDDEEHSEALTRGAAAKLLHTFRHASALGVWPWPYSTQSRTPFKGTTRQLLIEAAAMIVAQIEKMDRTGLRLVPCSRCGKQMEKRPTDGFTICAPCWEAEIAAIEPAAAPQSAQAPVTVGALRALIANDAYAISFQSMSQYRSAVIKTLDAALAVQPTTEGL